MAVNKIDRNCIPSKEKAKWKEGQVVGPGFLPYPCPVLDLAGGHQVTSTDPPGVRQPPELTGTSLGAGVRTLLGEC